MGSLKQAHTSTCTSSSYPPLSSSLRWLTAPQLTPLPPLTTLLQFTRRRSSPPSLSPTSTEWLMTTARLTSRRQSHKMAMESSLAASWLLFPMAESRPPLTPLITTTDSSLKSPTREPQSTPQSPRRNTAMPPPTRLPLMPQPLLTSPLLNYLLD